MTHSQMFLVATVLDIAVLETNIETWVQLLSLRAEDIKIVTRIFLLFKEHLQIFVELVDIF